MFPYNDSQSHASICTVLHCVALTCDNTSRHASTNPPIVAAEGAPVASTPSASASVVERDPSPASPPLIPTPPTGTSMTGRGRPTAATTEVRTMDRLEKEAQSGEGIVISNCMSNMECLFFKQDDVRVSAGDFFKTIFVTCTGTTLVESVATDFGRERFTYS